MDRGENRWAQGVCEGCDLAVRLPEQNDGLIEKFAGDHLSGARSCDHNATYQVLRRNSMVPLLRTVNC